MQRMCLLLLWLRSCCFAEAWEVQRLPSHGCWSTTSHEGLVIAFYTIWGVFFSSKRAGHGLVRDTPFSVDVPGEAQDKVRP